MGGRGEEEVSGHVLIVGFTQNVIVAIFCPQGETRGNRSNITITWFEFSAVCIFQITKLLNAELSFPEREV